MFWHCSKQYRSTEQRLHLNRESSWIKPPIFPCHHHVLKIIMEEVFTSLKIYSKETQASFVYLWEDLSPIQGKHYSICCFKDHVMPWDDYRYFLEELVITLGGIPKRGSHFQAPDAIHQRQWMCRIQVCFRVFVLIAVPNKMAKEWKIFQSLLLMYSDYTEAWFQAGVPAQALP